jgi:outer membrane receptor for ferrienterochelin and colicins
MRLRILSLLLVIACCKASLAQTDTTLKKYQLNDVVVTGQYVPQSVRNSVYRVRTVSREAMQLRGATDVLGVLSNELGVRLSNDAALGETDVELMGTGGLNVKILLDGVPLVDRGSMRQSLSQVDVNSIERIEIVEGPMSVIYGTDALAGVINIITRKGGGNRLSVTARVQEETVGKEYRPLDGKGLHNESLGLRWSGKGWFAGGGITRNDFGGWQGRSTGRKKEWHPKDQLFLNGTLGYGNDRLNVWYRLDYLDEDISNAGNINPNNGKALDQHYITGRYTHQLQGDWRLNERWSFNGAASYQDYKRVTRSTTRDFVAGTNEPAGDAGAQDVSRFGLLFFRGTALHKISDAISLQPGFEIKRDQGSGERIDGKQEIADYALFVSSEIKPVTGLNIRPGLRFSRNSVYDAPPVIPSINVKLALNRELDLRASYGRGFRAPTLRELYFYFFDASHAIKGNPNLKAEHSNSFNAALSWQRTGAKAMHFTTTLSGFYNEFDNQIDIGYDADDPGISTYINIQKFRTTGGTLEGVLDYKHLRASLGFSAIGRYNRYSDDPSYEKDNPTPAFQWTPEVNASFVYKFLRAGTDVSVFYKYNGKRPVYELATIDNKIVPHLAETAAFHFADISVRQRILKQLSLTGGVRNLFNVTWLRNTSLSTGQAHNTGGPVMMWYGRSYFLGLNFNWSNK